MKAHFFFQLIIVLIADFALGLEILNNQSGYPAGIILSIDLIVGPLQVAPALAMIFIDRFNNKYFWCYIILAMMTIGIMVISPYCFGFDGNDGSEFLNMLYFSFLLAHYFVLVLYKTARINQYRI